MKSEQSGLSDYKLTDLQYHPPSCQQKDVYDQAKQKVKVETGTVSSDIALLQ